VATAVMEMPPTTKTREMTATQKNRTATMVLTLVITTPMAKSNACVRREFGNTVYRGSMGESI
jgi:hypothetical protein